MAVGWCLLVLVVAVTLVTGEVTKQYGLIPTEPGKSCRDIYELNPNCRGRSGYYVIIVESTPNFVYCDMELECCEEKGWMRLNDVDVANGDKCSNEWHKIRAPVAAYRAPSDDAGCYPAHLSTHHVPYYT